MSDLRYPIGKPKFPQIITKEHISSGIDTLRQLPSRLRDEISTLSNEQLNTPYRENGWTVNQVIHHISESHMNGFIRFKWALTENTPKIKAYKEDKWANYADDITMTVTIGLNLIDALHQKWVYLLESFTDEEWDKAYYHPEDKKTFLLKESLLMYKWHSDHHLAHISNLKKRNNW